MKKLILGVVLVLGWISCTNRSVPGQSAAAQTEAIKARRIEILFLGDNGHHQPAERVPAIMSALGSKGINITYSDKLEDLNTANLNQYDGLLIYANWDTIAPAQEKALTDFVASGKGLIPVHCASYCFRNSPEFVKMVGGQFWRHRMDTIQAEITQPAHSAMLGVKAPRVYDETYLHSQLQPDNNVLMVREIKADQEKDKPGQKTEPYTWTRSYGKGRVFYTAYGHDDRTWNNADFITLLEKGILWAVGDKVKKAHDALSPEPFTFREAKLPNYEKRPGPQLQQGALNPEESVKHIQVPVEFDLSVFAAEPNVMHPIAMSWDERGRLYVLITKDYPNERKDQGGSDYILICEDTNNDGKADKFSKYAEGLSIPTGMVFANGGLIVTQAPHVLFLKDTDGDDKADVKKILFTGFGTSDTHAGPSNLHYGFDNWIWGCVGYSGFKGKVGSDSLKFSQGFYRFKPDGSRLEYMTGTSNNTWGFAFNETGDVFGSTANNSHGWYMAIPNQDFNSAPGLENGSRSIDTHKDMKPITPRIRQVDVFGGFTAAAGHNFYTARSFPKKYWNKIAFVCEPTGHLVHQNVIVKNGTDYQDSEGFNLLAGADEWVSPVFAEVGPDGAVWIADWYSFIIQHNPTPKGFNNGLGNAYDTDLRDYTHGRIYRVGYKAAPAYKALSLSKDRPQELIAALKNDNMFWRSHAQRLLVERGQKDIVPQLIELVKDPSLDETGINPSAIHAIRTLQGLGALDGSDESALKAVISALKHPCAGVRKTAVQVLPLNSASVQTILNEKVLEDKESLVVLNGLLALSKMPLTSASESAILSLLEQSRETSDRWLPDAFACAVTSHDGKLYKELIQKLMAKSSVQPKTTSEGMSSHDHASMNHSAPKVEEKSAAASAKPDITITDVRITPSSPIVREGISIAIELTNNGSAIPKGTIVPISIRIEGAGQKVDLVSKELDGLGAGESYTITKGNNGPWVGNLGFFSDKPGNYSISIEVDRENLVAESNKSNNSKVKKFTYSVPKEMTTYVLERATKSYTSIAPVDSVLSLLKKSRNMDESNASAIVKGVSDGWNPKRKETLTAQDKAFLVSLNNSVSEDNKVRFGKLLTALEVSSEKEVVDPNVQIVKIKSVHEAMQYDKKEFTVIAGKPVELTFENPDNMQHNLVIGKPKSTEIIGNAADKMITAKDGADRNYVPSIPQVIAATPLVNPNQSYKLKFTAPAQAGDYPFICTFPGHWRIMSGVMKVLNK
ncbi:putative membrane-bound dehydrogenase domain-containing protein [Pseudarcicella hirudinis]|uniref:Putative membrane-bound dehydrogenase domain-containing protein n=2 Tax=Pseudarcicella hirudinis TaxID=1079859 RepID=A0A1I5XWJ1_9BACT|nr:PVC-type heme-binding CxxCH protein [Pseudarcicella hirudinis]SFQ36342.1 putative membrane-bound dehydrogenase domain-containing protein [Pseudarcicella hirudinis]